MDTHNFELAGSMFAISGGFMVTSLLSKSRCVGFILGVLACGCLMVVYVGAEMWYLFGMSCIYILTNLVGIWNNRKWEKTFIDKGEGKRDLL